MTENKKINKNIEEDKNKDKDRRIVIVHIIRIEATMENIIENNHQKMIIALNINIEAFLIKNKRKRIR
jgi:hypothetical protein